MAKHIFLFLFVKSSFFGKIEMLTLKTLCILDLVVKKLDLQLWTFSKNQSKKNTTVKKVHDQTDLIRNKFPSFHAEKDKDIFLSLK